MTNVSSERKAALLAAIKQAMKSGDKSRLATLRLLSAAIKQREVDSRQELDDAAVVAILDKESKQRKESIAQYSRAGREDLVAIEQAELDVIAGFLPQPLSKAEVDQLIDEAVQAESATSIRDMGRVMNRLRPQLQGRADIAAASAEVKSRLGG